VRVVFSGGEWFAVLEDEILYVSADLNRLLGALHHHNTGNQLWDMRAATTPASLKEWAEYVPGDRTLLSIGPGTGHDSSSNCSTRFSVRSTQPAECQIDLIAISSARLAAPKTSRRNFGYAARWGAALIAFFQASVLHR
jgi:hypothetical protein